MKDHVVLKTWIRRASVLWIALFGSQICVIFAIMSCVAWLEPALLSSHTAAALSCRYAPTYASHVSGDASNAHFCTFPA